jgi:hypothetical protein
MVSAPNRKAEVEKAFAGLTIHPKTEADDGRRQNLCAVGQYLNTLDAGQWGCLVKTDQGNKIPADILVWKPTREHFDVITGDGGPTWIACGTVPKPEWVWRAIPDGPAPEPPGTSTPIPDAENWHKKLLALAEFDAALAVRVAEAEAALTEIRRQIADMKPCACQPVTVQTGEKLWHTHTVTTCGPQEVAK